jgi:hypothetical protein
LQRFLNDICTKSIKKVVAINELPLPFFMLHSIENCYKWVPIYKRKRKLQHFAISISCMAGDCMLNLT